MLVLFVKILFMLLAINGAPVLVARVFESRGDMPVDLGRLLRDSEPLFGSSKTWRGLASALVVSCLLSVLFGYGLWFGLVFGVLVMAGDLLSSFVKRRRGLKPGDRSSGWDQLPESLLPSVYAVFVLGLPWWWRRGRSRF